MFRDAGAQVVGVSRDPPDSHRRFAAHHRLPFLLLSDADGAVHGLYGAQRLAGLVSQRKTFVIDRGGTIRMAFSALLLSGTHVDEALQVVRQLST